jgi:SAM-dependent methyltransferase
MAVNSRRFLARAVAWTAQQGIRQWLDLGGGMPTRGTVTWTTEHGHAETAAITPLHEAAQAAADDDPVSYVYVDLDPIAVSHAQLAAAAPQSAVRAVRADFVDTASVLRSPEVTGVLDFSRPADLILGMVLHFLPEDEASTVVASYARVLAPGSYVIVSIGRNDDDTVFAEVRNGSGGAGDLYNYTQPQILGFLAAGGLELVEPGLVLARAWRAGWSPAAVSQVAPAGAAYALGVVARKP